MQQAREEDIARVKEIYARAKVAAEVAPFFSDLPARIAAGHLVVARSGASTVAELAAIGRPAILVPLPHALDQDQSANAGVLERAGGALRLPQDDFTPDRLAAEISALASAPQKLVAMAAAARSEGSADAAERLADLVAKVIKGNAAMKLPRNIGPIHFIGIGGIGMSGIAEVLMNLGYTVQGSDAADSAKCETLARQRRPGFRRPFRCCARRRRSGRGVHRDQARQSRARAARTRRLPVVRRAEMLAELMRLKRCIAIAGTHGKTTTTSLVAALVDAGGFDPTVINGGIINAYGTNARLGAGDLMVVEADESDGTFLKLPADVAIVTNVDPEHLDHFKTFDAVQEAFRAFVENVPFYGFAVMCTDHPVVQRLVGQITDRRVVTYGENLQADVRLADLDHVDGRSCFSIVFRDRAGETVHEIENLALPMPGRHNALNATAAIAVARELGISDDLIRKALESFGGVRRRFTRTGAWNGIPIIDDYGHHPVEIAAVLRAARELSRGQVIAVVQPHRYTRLSSLFEQFSTCFNDADTVIVAHVYAAGETPLPGADRDSLVQGLRAHGHRQVIPLDGPQDLPRVVRRLAQPGDIVVCLGAGNITQWAYALPGELAALDAVA